MKRYLIGGVIIVVFVIWGAYAFLETTVTYVPIQEALRSRSTVQVLGRIDFEKVRYDTARARLEFEIYDAEATDPNQAARMAVVYYGSVPGNFDQATSVVLKGRGQGDVFAAEQMFVKCPSKYQGSEGEGYQDIKRHQGSDRGGG